MDKKLLDFGIDCLTRYALVTHGCMVGEDSHYDGVFHQVIGLKSIIEIEVRMACCSRDAILDELEAGQSNGIERNVIRTAHTLDRDGRKAEVANDSTVQSFSAFGHFDDATSTLTARHIAIRM